MRISWLAKELLAFQEWLGSVEISFLPRPYSICFSVHFLHFPLFQLQTSHRNVTVEQITRVDTGMGLWHDKLVPSNCPHTNIHDSLQSLFHTGKSPGQTRWMLWSCLLSSCILVKAWRLERQRRCTFCSMLPDLRKSTDFERLPGFARSLFRRNYT